MVKKEFRISKGYTLMTDFLAKKIYVRFPNLHMDLQSLNSLYGYSLMKMAKKGIQRTPSMYDEEDIWTYLVSTYGLGDLQLLKSNSRKQYMLRDSVILNYALKTTENKKLSEDLKLMYACTRLKDNIDELELLLSTTVNNELPRSISPTAYIQNGHILYRPKYDLTSSLIINLTQETQVKVAYYTNVYYTFLTAKCWGTLDTSKNVKTWNFLKGMTRESESEFLESILKGDILATTTEGIAVQQEYFKQKTIRGEDFMFTDTLDERREILNTLYEGLDRKGIEVKGLTDFCVFYKNKPEEELEKVNKEKYIVLSKDGTNSNLKTKRRKRVQHKIVLLTGYYIFDTDNKEFLPTINRVLGYSGEFSREPQYEGQLSYQLINSEYEYEEFYRVEEDPCLYLEDIPVYKHSGSNSEIISTLKSTGQLSTDLSAVRRMEIERDEKQVANYWGDALNYERERVEYDNTSEH